MMAKEVAGSGLILSPPPPAEELFFAREFLADTCPQAIFVLGGGRLKNRLNITISFGTSAYSDLVNVNGVALVGGAKARVIAAAELTNWFPQAYVVALSHVAPRLSGQVNPPEDFLPLSYAEVVAAELNHRGVSAKRIITHDRPNSTLTEMVEIISLAAKNCWDTIVVVTNGYHLERAWEFYQVLGDDKRRPMIHSLLGSALTEQADLDFFEDKWALFEDYLRKLDFNPTRSLFISAEEILKCRHPLYPHLIGRVEALPAYQARLASEHQGVLDFSSGKYIVDKASITDYLSHSKAGPKE